MLPTFVVIGAMKAGTTSLALYLRAHPDVFVTKPKEPDFFGENWARGVEWYSSLFAGAESAHARGEASTHYTMAPYVAGVPERMASVVPDARLVYLIRNPVHRIRSMYLHLVARGAEERSIEHAVREDPRYLDLSRYARQVDRFLECFDRRQILVASSERLRDDRARETRKVFEFIGVDPDAAIPDLDREVYRGVDQRQVWRPVRRSLDVLRRRQVLARLPARAKRPLRRLLSSPVEVRTSDELEGWIWEELREDLARLRPIVGADFDLWGRA